MQRPQDLYFPKKSDISRKKSDRLAACRTHRLLARADRGGNRLVTMVFG
jgi:hypothetical protein